MTYPFPFILERVTKRNTFKSTYDILDELADKWQSLTDIQQASITELIAGKRQGNIVSALMTNFDIARKATQTALNSDGSAEKENEKYMESISGKMGAFKAQFQEFSSTLLSTDVFKTFVDSGTDFLNILTQIIDKVGILSVGLGAFGAVKLFKNLD